VVPTTVGGLVTTYVLSRLEEITRPVNPDQNNYEPFSKKRPLRGGPPTEKSAKGQSLTQPRGDHHLVPFFDDRTDYDRPYDRYTQRTDASADIYYRSDGGP
jgi:hypothetical protein